jgi:hypothetical protein
MLAGIQTPLAALPPTRRHSNNCPRSAETTRVVEAQPFERVLHNSTSTLSESGLAQTMQQIAHMCP